MPAGSRDHEYAERLRTSTRIRRYAVEQLCALMFDANSLATVDPRWILDLGCLTEEVEVQFRKDQDSH